MRTIIFFITILLISSPTLADLADWSKDFHTNYYEKGIDSAVVIALSAEIPPKQIIKTALPIEGLKEEVLIKALYCALAQPVLIQEGAFANGISNKKLGEGYQLALTECAKEMEEAFNSVTDATVQYPELSPSKRIRRPIRASPWTFE